jgi:hypothetical protein
LTNGSRHTVKNNFGIPQRHFLRVNNFPLGIPLAYTGQIYGLLG